MMLAVTLLVATCTPPARAEPQVTQAVDVPRPQVELRYQHLRVRDLADLLGAPAAPPPGGVESPAHGAATNACLAVGEWAGRAAQLVAEGKAELLHEGSVATLDGYWGTVYLGDPEARQPEFLFQARPVVVDGGAVWLSVAYGTLRRAGEAPRLVDERENGMPGEVCVNCGPGLGEMLLVPELVVSTRVEAGQSALAGGAKWALEEVGSLAAPPDEWVVVSFVVREVEQ